MKRIILLILIFNYFASFSQNLINLPKVNFLINYGEIEQIISISIDKNSDIFIEKKKVKLENFNNEIYHAIIDKFIEKPNLIKYLAIELNVDEKVNYSIISDLLDKLKTNGLFKLFITCKSDNVLSSEEDKTGFLIKLNSFYYPYNNKIIDKTIYSLENDLIYDNENDLVLSDSITYLEGIDTRKILKNQLDIPSKIVKIDIDKVVVDNLEYSFNDFKFKLKNWYNKNDIMAILILPNDKSQYKNLVEIISEIYLIVETKREEYSKKKYEANFKNLDSDKKKTVMELYPLVFVIEK